MDSVMEAGYLTGLFSEPIYLMGYETYKENVFPKALRKRLAVEAGSTLGWCKYVTDEGDVIGIKQFGESAPGEEVMQEYGFTVENVVQRAKALLS